MKVSVLSYHRPTDLAGALRLASEPERMVIAGGTDVFPALKQGQHPKIMLDLTAIPELAHITETDKGWRIGASVRWMDIIKADLPDAFTGLKQAARQVGSVQIQNSATLVGNICNASPAADGIPPLLTLKARVEVSSMARGLREMPLAAFILGARKTLLEPDELVTAVIIPSTSKTARAHFEKLGSRSYMVISIAMVAAYVSTDSNGRIEEARIAVGACSAVAQRLEALERDCIGKLADELDVTSAHLSALSPIDDVRGSAAYRNDAVAALCLLALQRAIGV